MPSPYVVEPAKSLGNAEEKRESLAGSVVTSDSLEYPDGSGVWWRTRLKNSSTWLKKVDSGSASGGGGGVEGGGERGGEGAGSSCMLSPYGNVVSVLDGAELPGYAGG